MSDFSVTDDLGKQIDRLKVDWTSLSSLFQYLQSELLHFWGMVSLYRASGSRQSSGNLTDVALVAQRWRPLLAMASH